MPFRVAARTVLHLGSELISSDAVAFYELIKNAFDAGSPRVDIRVVVRISHGKYQELLDDLNRQKNLSRKMNESTLRECKEQILREIDIAAPDAKFLKVLIADSKTYDEVCTALQQANYIEIKDTGEGMSFKDLDEVYLTIGTRSRLQQREAQKQVGHKKTEGEKRTHPILGEKGVGRLSTMRLGNQLEVKTSKKGETKWNLLKIDWNWFSHDSADLIETIEVAPQHGLKKDDSEVSGTTVRISALVSEWSLEKLATIAIEEFSKFTDPFTSNGQYPIKLKFNDERVSIPRFDKILFDHAHAVVEASFLLDEKIGPCLTGKINYLLGKREKSFQIKDIHLISMAGVPVNKLHSLGPFKVKFHWFNRRILTAIEGIGDLQQVRNLQARWAGGLMVFRDGFRVNPYGSPDDDWLDLDREAFSAGGYKVNRRQIIGKVDITSENNPQLIDQTNREGLRHCEERTALVKILQHVLWGEFRRFLDEVDKEKLRREPVSFDDLEERVENQEKEIKESLRVFIKNHPELKQDKLVITIRESLDQINKLMHETKELAESYQAGRTQIVHLAGLGLIVEILAHELNRATYHALVTLAERNNDTTPDMDSLLSTLEAQLKTLQKRLRILDPLSTSGRQKKEPFNLVAWIDEILKSHDSQFKRHNISLELRVKPSGSTTSLRIEAVKGMIVQIMENLISNSVYWLKQQKTQQPSFKPKVSILINTTTKEIRFTDNGPGIDPEWKDEIFQPFFTTKPPGKGKGLGLYISQEIAKYNGANLYLSDERDIHADALNTFVLVLEAKNS